MPTVGPGPHHSTANFPMTTTLDRLRPSAMMAGMRRSIGSILAPLQAECHRKADGPVRFCAEHRALIRCLIVRKGVEAGTMRKALKIIGWCIGG